MRVSIAAFIFVLVFVVVFGILAATRTQTCQGYWNKQHTVLTAKNCHVNW